MLCARSRVRSKYFYFFSCGFWVRAVALYITYVVPTQRTSSRRRSLRNLAYSRHSRLANFCSGFNCNGDTVYLQFILAYTSKRKIIVKILVMITRHVAKMARRLCKANHLKATNSPTLADRRNTQLTNSHNRMIKRYIRPYKTGNRPYLRLQIRFRR